jgi:hypothetical protein
MALSRAAGEVGFDRIDREVEHSGNFVRDLARDALVLFLDFNQDAQNAAAIGEVYQAFRIRDRGKARLDPDPTVNVIAGATAA